MKKIYYVLMILIFVFSLVACNNKKEEQIIPQIGNKIEENKKEFDYVGIENIDNYKMVQTIELPENPTTGYMWQYEIKNPSVVVSVNNEYISNTDETLVGAGGTRIFSFQGVKEGQSEIEFRKERSFQENSTIETLRYILSVNANKEIAITDQIHK